MIWDESLSEAKKGVQQIYAKIDRIAYYDIDSILDAVRMIIERSDDRIKGQIQVKIDVEREVTLAEVMPILSQVKQSVKIVEDTSMGRKVTTKVARDGGTPLIVAVAEVAAKLSTSWGRVSDMHVMDVIARLVVAEEGVQVKQLARRSVVKLLNGDDSERKFEETVARYNHLVAKESLSQEENREASVLKEQLDEYPDVDHDSKLRLMIDEPTWQRLLFGGAKE